MTYVRRQAAKYAYSRISYALKNFLIDPTPIKIQGKNTIFFLTKPKRIQRRKQIGLVIIGDFDETILPEIELDLIAGVASGHILNLEYYKNLKFKAKNFRIMENIYGEHEFKHKEIKKFGETIGQEIYKNRYMRKALKKTTKVKKMNWYEGFNDQLPRLKFYDCLTTPVIIFWEKMVTHKEWVIPIEAVRIWQYMKFYSGEGVQEMADDLKNAILTDNKTEQKGLNNLINAFVNSEEKKRKMK